MKKIEDKDVIKVIISSGTEKPCYLRKKGMCLAGCYVRIGSSKEQMTTEMIDNLYAKRVRNSLNKIESPRQDLKFEQLKIYQVVFHLFLKYFQIDLHNFLWWTATRDYSRRFL